MSTRAIGGGKASVAQSPVGAAGPKGNLPSAQVAGGIPANPLAVNPNYGMSQVSSPLQGFRPGGGMPPWVSQMLAGKGGRGGSIGSIR